ncbi:MAG: hypothetical protein J6Z36_01480, partial [Clostridia bacterium]|nr:hypothetical protein [Clostridia bacterium]
MNSATLRLLVKAIYYRLTAKERNLTVAFEWLFCFARELRSPAPYAKGYILWKPRTGKVSETRI